jgi:hypothetical protein
MVKEMKLMSIVASILGLIASLISIIQFVSGNSPPELLHYPEYQPLYEPDAYSIFFKLSKLLLKIFVVFALPLIPTAIAWENNWRLRGVLLYFGVAILLMVFLLENFIISIWILNCLNWFLHLFGEDEREYDRWYDYNPY